jgi:hypothetical protein
MANHTSTKQKKWKIPTRMWIEDLYLYDEKKGKTDNGENKKVLYLIWS